MRYGILGGTFDPPHSGHLDLATAAMEALELDEVIFVPAGKNPLKHYKPIASPQDRLKMIHLLIEGRPGLSLSDIETSRPGPSYAIDTLRELGQARHGRYWWIMGYDAALDFPQWHKPEDIVRQARLAVAERDGHLPDELKSRLPKWVYEVIDRVPMPPVRVSSSMIREAILRGDARNQGADPKVWDYIKERGLYQN